MWLDNLISIYKDMNRNNDNVLLLFFASYKNLNVIKKYWLYIISNTIFQLKFATLKKIGCNQLKMLCQSFLSVQKYKIKEI